MRWLGVVYTYTLNGCISIYMYLCAYVCMYVCHRRDLVPDSMQRDVVGEEAVDDGEVRVETEGNGPTPGNRHDLVATGDVQNELAVLQSDTNRRRTDDRDRATLACGTADWIIRDAIMCECNVCAYACIRACSEWMRVMYARTYVCMGGVRMM